MVPCLEALEKGDMTLYRPASMGLIGVFALCVVGRPLFSEAGNFVSKNDRIWAKKALQQEEQLQAIEGPVRTLAVLYFQKNTGEDRLDPLRKGLTLMLITDLSKVKEIVLFGKSETARTGGRFGIGRIGARRALHGQNVGQFFKHFVVGFQGALL